MKIETFTFVFIENLAKAQPVKLRHYAGFVMCIKNLHPIVYLFLTYALDAQNDHLFWIKTGQTVHYNISGQTFRTKFINVERVSHHPKVSPDFGNI